MRPTRFERATLPSEGRNTPLSGTADIGTISEPPGGSSGAPPEPGPESIVDVDLVYTTFAGSDFGSPMLPVQSTGLTSIASPAMAVFPEVTNSVKLFSHPPWF